MMQPAAISANGWAASSPVVLEFNVDSLALAAEGHLKNGEFLLCLFLSVALLIPLVGTLDCVHLLCLHAAVVL